jgi:DNA replication protein DnaC
MSDFVKSNEAVQFKLTTEWLRALEKKVNSMSVAELEAFRRESLKADVEKLNAAVSTEEWGDDCHKCHGKRQIFMADYKLMTAVVGDCNCKPIADARRLIKESGLEKLFSEFSFEKFKTDTDTKIQIKDIATRFLESSTDEWLAILGQGGSGKTHICTAVCFELLKQGVPVRYFRWQYEGTKVKQLSNDEERYWKLLDPLLMCQALYIDDLFFRKDEGVGEPIRTTVTPADILLAHRLIDYRASAGLKTIISCNDSLSDLREIDERIAGRIYRQAGKFIYQVPKDKKNDYRFNGKPRQTHAAMSSKED